MTFALWRFGQISDTAFDAITAPRTNAGPDPPILQLAGLPDDSAGQTQRCLRYALDVPAAAI